MSTKIDVPNLPSKKNPKKMVADPESIPEAPPRNEISTTGKPEKYNNNEMIRSIESGTSAIPVMFPGQKESIKKVLRKNKTENTPEAPAPVPVGPEKTTKNVVSHVPDVKAIQGREPFSYSAIRKMLYQ
jgi:hypothetical protein